MARTRRRLTPAPATDKAQADLGVAMLRKVETIRQKLGWQTREIAGLRQDLEGAQRLAHDAQVREALSRTQLTLALNDSLVARAELEAGRREQALTALRANRPIRPRTRSVASARLDRILARLGSLGRALVIARSGVWRNTGRPLHDLRHMAAYARRGARADVAPLAPFDQAWYLAAFADVAARRTPPLVHYLVSGAREGRPPTLLFDRDWYARQAGADFAASGLSALEHYVRVGAVQGLSPHPLFDVGHYLAQTPALAPGDDPLSHYLREGGAAGLSPHPLFDVEWYRRQVGDWIVGRPALAHYLSDGWRNGWTPHPLFDPAFYLENHPPAVAAAEEDHQPPLCHFLSSGGDALASPSAWFDTPAYVEARGVLPPGVNPLVDYLRGGAWSVAEARPGFPTAAYLASRPELAKAGLTPLEHWARRAAN